MPDEEAPQRVVVCQANEVPQDGMVRATPPGIEPLALYRIDGTIYVTADGCTHATGSLSEGELDGRVVVCPVHWAEFDVPTGKPLCFPATTALTVYHAEVEDGQVVIYPQPREAERTGHE